MDSSIYPKDENWFFVRVPLRRNLGIVTGSLLSFGTPVFACTQLPLVLLEAVKYFV